jgi:hypothetical protein
MQVWAKHLVEDSVTIGAKRNAIDLPVTPDLIRPFLLIDDVNSIRERIRRTTHDARKVSAIFSVANDSPLHSWIERHGVSPRAGFP